MSRRGRMAWMSTLAAVVGTAAVVFVGVVVWLNREVCCIGCPMYPTTATQADGDTVMVRGCISEVASHLAFLVKLVVLLAVSLVVLAFAAWLLWRKHKRRVDEKKAEMDLVKDMAAFLRDKIAFLDDAVRSQGVPAEHVLDAYVDTVASEEHHEVLARRLWPRVLDKIRKDTRVQRKQTLLHGRQVAHLVWVANLMPPRWRGATSASPVNTADEPNPSTPAASVRGEARTPYTGRQSMAATPRTGGTGVGATPAGGVYGSPVVYH